MNRTKIQYADYTWNPILGCKHGCFYCYGKRLNDRFKWLEFWDEPSFHGTRLLEPLNLQKPQTILVGSMSDVFGEWIPADWIQQIIKITYYAKQHTFLFLTKNPKRYHEFKFQTNCFLGTTITGGMDLFKVFQMKRLNRPYWISYEPLFDNHNYAYVFSQNSPPSWVVIGAMTGPHRKRYPVQKEWVGDIVRAAKERKVPVFMKENLGDYWDGEWREERYVKTTSLFKM